MVKTLVGDCVEKMRELPDECVHCCVTSPPYFGLRNYGTAKWEGGVADCDHVGSDRYYTEKSASVASAENFSEAGDENAARLKQARWREGGTCVKCGAVYVDRQIGLEKTPDAYVAKMVEVFAEVKRVLRPDGTLWLNLGDSYNAARNGGHAGGAKQAGLPRHDGIARSGANVPGLKQKDLIGIPWRVAFALQADGWYLRCAIPWIKRNGMPESVTDRPSQTIEYIFVLTKSPRPFYDAEAVKMPLSASFANDKRHQTGSTDENEKIGYADAGAQNPKRLHRMFDKEKPNGRLRRTRDWFIESWQGLMTDEDGDPLAFVVNTKSYKGAHFATFPPKLIEPCILASTSAYGCCSQCEAPWVRIVGRPCKKCAGFIPTQGKSCPACGHVNDWKTERGISEDLVATEWSEPGKATPRKLNESGKQGSVPPQKVLSQGWKATCECNAEIEPCVVLDPFGGSGTTGQVAQEHGRNAVLIELNENYLPLIAERTGAAA